MNSLYLEKIVELAAVAEPVEVPSWQEWIVVERDLNVALPDDYKRLISSIGSGLFGDLVLMNPASRSPVVGFRGDHVLEYHRRIAPMVRDAGIRVFPEIGGFLRIGTTGSGAILMTETLLADRRCYKICWFDLDLCCAHVLRMTVCQLLYDLYLGVLSAEWAKEARESVWDLSGENRHFFVSQGTWNVEGPLDSLNE